MLQERFRLIVKRRDMMYKKIAIFDQLAQAEGFMQPLETPFQKFVWLVRLQGR